MNTYWKPMDFDRFLLEDYAEDVCQMQKELAIDELKGIDKSLENYTPEEVRVIVDFLCNDPNFKKLTNGDAGKLHNITSSMEVSTLGVVAIGAASGGILMSSAAAHWGLWKWMHQKTVKGLAEWAKSHNPNTIDDDVFEKKAKVPTIKDFEALQDGITKALPLLEKLVSGTEVKDQDLQNAIKNMGFQVDMSRFDNYSGHLYAILVSAIKGLGVHIAAGLMAVLVGVLSVGILAIPAAIYAAIWAGIKTNAAYRQAYEKWQADSSMIERGWNKQAFMKAMQNFQLHYRGIMGYATKLDKLNGGEVYTRSEAAHAHLFADVILLEIKTEARILGTIVGVMDKILSVGLKG